MLKDYECIELDKPIHFSTIKENLSINKELVTPTPNEFNEKSYIHWKLTNIKNNNFDAIIGQNILKPIKAIINLEKEYVEINGNKIKFINMPYNYEDINILTECKENLLDILSNSDMNEEEKQKLEYILKANSDLFFQEGKNLSHTHEIQHEIVTKTSRPTYNKIYRYPQIHEEEISRQMNEMLRQGIIKESNSPYNSPLWIVPKKQDNSMKKKWRIVIDYRKLNEVTIDDKFPIPHIETILSKLGRAQYFTTLDLAKGFHQVLIKEEDRPKTAFSTPQGHFEFIRMPFGLKNAPATFQRLMNSVLREYINKICVVYLDDILIFSSSIEEHTQNINKIFSALRKHNLKIQVDKCKFFAKTTEFLGHTLTTEGIQPNLSKIENIQKLKLPTTSKQIKSFLGITGYYRKFVRDYAKVAHGLTKYLKKDIKINTRDPQYISSFEKLKNLLVSPPILKYPDFNKKFGISTDASDFAIGAVLTQDSHPISYASRTLNKHERSYSTTEKELLAIVWAVTYYRPYIYGRAFDLLTDHQPLKWLQIKNKGKDINPRLQRWLIKLGEYNININYVKGKENNVADFLSRIDSNTGEIHSLEEDNISTNATIHSQEEELNDHFPILHTIVNRFNTQIILTKKKIMESEELGNTKKIFISAEDIKNNNFIDLCRRHINSGKVGIFSYLTDNQYNIVQQKLIQIFNRQVKFFRCEFHAKDMKNEEQVYKQIAQYH